MKLIFCPDCRDVHGLIMQTWRTCLCGASGGQYNVDGMTATIGGKARVFGVGNPFFDPLYVYLQDTDLNHGLKKMQKDLYGHNKGDCWWGEYEGDQQIFRIESATGPRLQLKIETDTGQGYNMVWITDKRSYSVDGKKPAFVTVPKNPMVKVTRWAKTQKGKCYCQCHSNGAAYCTSCGNKHPDLPKRKKSGKQEELKFGEAVKTLKEEEK